VSSHPRRTSSPASRRPNRRGRVHLLVGLLAATTLVAGAAGVYAGLVKTKAGAPTITFTTTQGVAPNGDDPGGVGPDAVGGSGEGVLASDFDSAPEVFSVDETAEGQGRRLLALIAAICVLGVTAAIIRAILAQRAVAQ